MSLFFHISIFIELNSSKYIYSLTILNKQTDFEYLIQTFHCSDCILQFTIK